MKKRAIRFGNFALIFVVAVVFAAGGFFAGLEYAKATLNNENQEDILETDTALTVHFLQLGNHYAGDSVFIDNGDVEMLIDAGSRRSSASHIKDYIDEYIDDGKIEYVIATHAHEDHIAGFAGDASNQSLLEAFDIGVIIDYAKSDSTSQVRGDYETKRDEAVTRGAKHFTALECFDGPESSQDGGAQKVWDLGDGAEFEILYNQYYTQKASTENNYSVVAMVRNSGLQYLFTGDMEEAGEKALVEYYDDGRGGLGDCALLKGGHHGSDTSNSEVLLDAISSEYNDIIVCICCCAGSAEYSPREQNGPRQFPKQDTIDILSQFTEKIYVTSVSIDYENNEFGPLNGDIVVGLADNVLTVTGSNNSTVLKDSDWFKQYRVWNAG